MSNSKNLLYLQCDAAWGSADKILSISIELGIYEQCRKILKRSALFFCIPVCERAHCENCMNDIQIFNDDLASIALKAKETNEVHVYEHPLFGKIRMFVQNGKTWFCGTDIATSLGYSNPRDAIVRHCKSQGVVIHDTPTNSGVQPMKFISEGNVYRLTAKSQMPKADKFESWIFDDIVPSVMQTGSYSVKPSLPKTYLEALKELVVVVEEKERLALENTTMKPKADYFDRLVDRKLLTNLRDTAKELKIPQNKFISLLLENKYVYRDTKRRLKPYADHTPSLFELKDYEHNGHTGTQLLITPKGKETFRLMFSA